MIRELRIALVSSIVVILVGTGLDPLVASAQDSGLPASVLQVKPQSVQIRSQLELARKYAVSAIGLYESTPPPAKFEAAHSAAYNAYVLIRVARAGMEWQRDKKKLPDPLLNLAFEKTTKAWNRSRYPVDAYHNAEAREQYQRNSIDALGDTIQLLDVILALVL